MTKRWLITPFMALVLAFTAQAAEPDLASYQFPAARLAALETLVTTNPEAKAQYAALRKLADGILSATPKPIAKIQTEGKLAKDPLKIATDVSLRDMGKILPLAYAWLLSHEDRYAAKASEFLVAWANQNQATGDPIDETNLEPMIQAYDLIKAALATTDRQKIGAWLSSVAQAEIASRKPGKDTSFNNWNSHRLKIVGLIGFSLNDQALIEFTEREFKHQIQSDLNPDGTSFDFLERDALHYHCYTLEPLLSLAINATLYGKKDWFTYIAPNGSSLAKSVAWLLPFAKGEQTHAEYVNSKVEFDRARAAAGQKEFQGGRLFEPEQATLTLEYDSYFDSTVGPLLQKVSNRHSDFPNWQMVVLNAWRTN
jgi:hypothetical protein